MPLSDLFKKSPKKEPAQNPSKPPSQDDSLLSPEMQKKRYDAAMEFLKMFQEKVPLVGGKPHAGTVLAVPARLAGSSLFRSLNYNNKEFAPGVVVLSNEVNDAWPQLLNLFAFYCKQNKIDVMAKPLVTKFPEHDQPRMTVEQVLAEYQDEYLEIMQRHGLDTLNGGRAGMVICSIVFLHQCTVAKDIDPYVAAGIVAMGIVEGAKTAPPPLREKHRTPPASSSPRQNNGLAGVLSRVAENSTSGSGTRLVLGDGMEPMQEAMSNGGKYVLVHPAVLNQLKQINVDPYLVYEAALRIEVESKIPRVDFVKVNVEDLFNEWKGKSWDQAPIYVRLMMWLKNNAGTYGYEQSRNSWVLKK